MSSQVMIKDGLSLVSVLLELPITVVQRANLSCLEPAADAVEVEGMVTHPPGNSALLAGGAGLVGLTLDTQVHDVVPANGAVVDHDIPGPQRHCVPLLYLEPLLILGRHDGGPGHNLAVTVDFH